METEYNVLKKTSPNDRITLYLRKRDYTSTTDPIDGVVSMDTGYVQGRKVFCCLVLHFRYGKEKDEIMGLKFRREFCIASIQIYPPLQENSFTHTELQDTLIKKCGPGKAFPFLFYFPQTAPQSVILQTGEKNDRAKPCGIHYFVTAFVANTDADAPVKRSSVQLDIRNVQYFPYQYMIEKQPHVFTNQNFLVCAGDVELETTLNKQIYTHGETVPVNISVANNSNKNVKKIKVTLYQNISITMGSALSYKRIIDETSTRIGCPIKPGGTLHTTLNVLPLLAGNTLKHGVAICGDVKRQKVQLSSTVVLPDMDERGKGLGIAVSYFIRVKLILGPMHNVTSSDLGFILTAINTHTYPEKHY